MSLESQAALARLFGLTVDTDAAPDPEPTGYQFIGGIPFRVSETPPPPSDESPDFDGGARETAPEPDDPVGDHGELLRNLLAPRDPGMHP